MIVEAIVENYDAKIALFNQLATINDDKTIFATNTSSLSISKIGNKVTHAQRVIGMHFFNPASRMKLVEIVKGEKTSDDVVHALVELAGRLGKISVICKDSPGFIVNRVARPYYIEALRVIEEGETDFASIDELLESTGFKMGPFKLMDLIGNDVNYAVSCSVYEQLNKPERLKPSFIQKEKVDRGELGKKTGKGYYVYWWFDISIYLSTVQFVPIQSYDNYIEANIIRSRLEQEQIICWLADENSTTTMPFLANSGGGIKLMVAESQVGRALELLNIFKHKAPE